MVRSKNVATPLAAVTGEVPPSVELPGLAPSAMPIAPANPVATFPKASSARTFTAGLNWWPATVVPGSVPKTSCVAAAGVMLNDALVAVLKPVALALSQYPLLVLSSVRVVNVATPLTAPTDVVPPSVLPPGLFPSATVTVPLKEGARFPDASSTDTCTAGASTTPAVLATGCTVKASCRAAPGVVSNAVLVAELTPGAVAVSV